MTDNSDDKDRRFPWKTIVGIVLVIIAVLYASQHPHGFFATLVRVLLAP